MIKTCPICGKQFATLDKRKKYCSKACALQGKYNHNSRINKETRANVRIKWAYTEALYLNHLAYENGVDELADYIYNNYNKRRK